VEDRQLAGRHRLRGTQRRVRRRSRAPPPPPDPSKRLEEQVDKQAHLGGDEHAQAH